MSMPISTNNQHAEHVPGTATTGAGKEFEPSTALTTHPTNDSACNTRPIPTQPAATPLWMKEREKTFLASDAEQTFIFTIDSVLSDLRLKDKNAIATSCDIFTSFFKIRLELQKIPFAPGNNFLNKTLRVHVNNEPFTVVPFVVFQPLISIEQQQQIAVELQYCVRSSNTRSSRLALRGITRQRLQFDDIILNYKPNINYPAFRLHDWNLQDCLTTAGTLIVKFPVTFRWSLFALSHATAIYRTRLTSKRNAEGDVIDGDQVTLACISDEDSSKRVSFTISAALLVAASPVFKRMFDTYDVQEKQERQVIIHDVRSRSVEQMIEYLHSGPQSVISRGIDGITHLARVADKYEILDLLVLCSRMMVHAISCDTVLEYYLLAVYLNLHDLKASCLTLLKSAPWGKSISFGEFWLRNLPDAIRQSNAAVEGLNDLINFFRDQE